MFTIKQVPLLKVSARRSLENGSISVEEYKKIIQLLDRTIEKSKKSIASIPQMPIDKRKSITEDIFKKPALIR